MTKLIFFDCESDSLREEQVYGKSFLEILYKDTLWGRILLFLSCRYKLVSCVYGWVQKLPITRSKVAPFIKKFGVDSSEFEKQDFDSFNDFFTRKLKKEVRPIDPDPQVLVSPCDGRFRLLEQPESFAVKGHTFSAEELLGDVMEYRGGPILVARLAPVDYHRFHFPCDCESEDPVLMPGPLFSVNPLAMRPDAYSRNRRYVTRLKSEVFGEIGFVEVGATNVGSIRHTAEATPRHIKGDERGYFEFGGSAIVLVLEPGQYEFAPHLREKSREGIEIFAKYGQALVRQARG